MWEYNVVRPGCTADSRIALCMYIGVQRNGINTGLPARRSTNMCHSGKIKCHCGKIRAVADFGLYLQPGTLYGC